MSASFDDVVHRLRRDRITLSVFFFISGLIFSTFTSRIPGLQQRFAMNNAQLGVLLACLPVGLIVSIPFAGLITHSSVLKNYYFWPHLIIWQCF